MTVGTEKLEAIRSSAQDELARRRLLEYARVMDPRFIPARHLVLVAEYLEKLERREIRKLAITMPPRHGKTRLVSQIFCAWHLSRHPDQDIVLASYGSEVAEGSSRAVRTLLTDERFPFVDVELREDSRSVGRWQTKQGATLIAAGVGTGLTGRGFSRRNLRRLTKRPRISGFGRYFEQYARVVSRRVFNARQSRKPSRPRGWRSDSCDDWHALVRKGSAR